MLDLWQDPPLYKCEPLAARHGPLSLSIDKRYWPQAIYTQRTQRYFSLCYISASTI